jgi:Flp pilus assembly protein TadB
MSSLLIAGFGAAGGIGVLIMISGLVGRPVLPTLGSFERRRDAASRATVRSGGAAAAFLATLAVTGWPVGAVLVAAAAVGAPRLIGGRAAREAAIARTEAIATWTEMVRDSISAASGLEEAINATAKVAPVPIRREVRLLVSRLERDNLPRALAAFGEDLAHPSGDLVVAALTIAARTEASDLTGLLSRLSDAIRGEARMRIRVDVGRTQVRTASKVIVGVVAATIALLALLNRDYLDAYSSFGGQLALLVVGGIFALGGFLLVRMAEIEMPERFSARPLGEASR